MVVKNRKRFTLVYFKYKKRELVKVGIYYDKNRHF
jgi:hypothetical protein